MVTLLDLFELDAFYVTSVDMISKYRLFIRNKSNNAGKAHQSASHIVGFALGSVLSLSVFHEVPMTFL